jgi:integral membrane sensor domain MASE1
MTFAGAPIWLGRAKLFAALVTAFAFSTIYSILLGRAGGQMSSIWTATGFLAGTLILLTGRWRIAAAVLCVAIQAAVSLALHDPLARILINPFVNLLEASIAAWLAVTYCGARRRRLSLRQLLLLILGAIVPAAMLAAVVGAGSKYILVGQDFIDGWLSWAIPGGLGMATVTPALLLVARESQYKEFRRSWIETIGLLGAVWSLTAVAFWQSDLPLQFVIFPALALVAFRLGPPGAAIAGFFVAMICLTLAMLGHGPTMLAKALDPVGRVRLTQVVVTAALCTTLAVAAIVADHSRLRQLLVSRDRAVRAARLRARAAEQVVLESIDRRRPAPARRHLV